MTLTTSAPEGIGLLRPPGSGSPRHHRGQPQVTAVLVAHDGARWLPRALGALAAQTRQPDVVVGVDTGSTDGTAALLGAALGQRQVVAAQRRTGFGAAVRLGLEHVAADETDTEAAGRWIWLLHDDAAPQPTALAHLLDAAAQSPQVGVVGPKLVHWDDPTRLLEVGLSVSRGGRRHTGVAERERDQGQHDHRTDVLAVGTAGMLVDRQLWDRLGGLDPALPLIRDDIDLCWRAHLAGRRVVLAPRAVVADAQAASRGQRSLDAVRGSVRRVDRRHALHVALARASWPALPLVLGWLVLTGLARSLAMVLAKAPGAAWDELASTLMVALTPWTWLGSRWRARGTRTVRRRDVARLLSPRWAFVRHGLERLGGLAALADLDDEPPLVAPESGPVADESDPVVLAPARWPRRLVRHPMTAVLLVLSVSTVAAMRHLGGAGALTGGELRAGHGHPGDLWHAAVDGWTGPGLGGPGVAPPAGVLRAVAASALTPLAGEAAASRSLDLLLLGAPVLAAISAYVGAGLVARSRWARAWAALAWGTTPLLTGALSQGRLGPVGAYLLLPLVAAGVARALTPRGRAAWRATCIAAIGLALVAAALPALLLAGLLVGAGGLVLGRGAVRVRALLLLVLTPALLGPWLGALASDPRQLLAGPGALQVGTAGTPLQTLAAFGPHAFGPAPWMAALVVGPLLLAGVAGLLRRGPRGTALLPVWGLGLLGLAGALAAPHVRLTTWAFGPVHPWAGTGLMLLALAAVAGAVVGVDGLFERLAEHRFGWRQLLVVPVVTLAVLAPLAAALLWAWPGVSGPLRRSPASEPAVAVDAARGPGALRTLVIGGDKGALTYRLQGVEPGPWSRDLAGRSATESVVTDAVRALVGPAPSTRDLLRLAVGYVVVDPAAPALVGSRLDTVGGLVRLGTDNGAALWRVQQPTARVSLRSGRQLLAVPVTGPHARVDTRVPPGAPGRRLVLSEPASPGWRATLDGMALPASRDTTAGWRQEFTVPAAGGHLVVAYVDQARRWWLVAQGVLAGVLLLLALPGRRVGRR